MKIQLTENTGHALRDSLIVLYQGKLERLKDECSRWAPQNVNHMAANEKVALLQSLIHELQRIDIIEIV